MRSKLFVAGMLLLPLAFVAAVCGSETTRIENTGDGDLRGITVAGEGKVTAPPDLAMITLGVSALRPTVAEARESAATSLAGMIDSMKANGIDEKDIQTQSLSIYPEYDYNNGNQLLRGFRVQNIVIAKIRDIDTTSKVVDDAVTAGGDNTSIQGISFTIDNPESLREEARRKAVEDARARAQTLASASGVDVGEPINITESGYSPPLPYDVAAGAERAAPDTATPIETGELDVVVTVNVTWEIVH
jgi:uncharacterized protein YggE